MEHLHADLPPQLTDAIRNHIWARAEQRAVSVARIMRAARYAFPDLTHTDGELAELVIRELILEGCDIHFDHKDANPICEPVFVRKRS